MSKVSPSDGIEAEVLRQRREEFEDPKGWLRGPKGDLRCEWGCAMDLIIGRREGGRFGWSIVSDFGVRDSRQSYPSEADAIRSLWEELQVGVL